MMAFSFYKNDRESQHQREQKNVLTKSAHFKKTEVPRFSFGTADLGLGEKGGQAELENFVKTWFSDPYALLNLESFSTGERLPCMKRQVEHAETCFSFESFLDRTDQAKFYQSKQPFYGQGERIAFIILPHWNAFFAKYKAGTTFIRRLFLPVATYRYFPTYQTEAEFAGKPRYDVVGPNIGLTIKRVWQDVLNIQYFAKFLKSQLGFEKVGIWAYSIGSPRGFLASIFSKNLFDFLIMNFLAYSFSQSLLYGIATKPISKRLLENLTEDQVEFFYSPLSPGYYSAFLPNLSQYTRLVQGKYDLVFGEDNSKRMVEELMKRASQVEIEYGDFGHTTLGEIGKAVPTILHNSRFVFKNSKLKLL